jgi:hypothetical protein
MKTLDRLLLGSGLLIPLWLLAGVWLTAQAYPGYDHLQQAMSQLGAAGSPTHSWSPRVNNSPLALLFALFAWGLMRRWHSSKLALLSAGLVLLHGMAVWAPAGSPATRGVHRYSHLPRSNCITCLVC